MRNYIVSGSTLVVFLIGSLLARPIILGNASVITLQQNQIAWETAKSFETLTGGTYLPIAGKDYTSKVRYFINRQWAVVSITPINSFSDPATVVFGKSGGNYVIALGPSNSFQSSSLNGLPKEVVAYLRASGVIE